MKILLPLICICMLLVGCSSAQKQPSYYLFGPDDSKQQANVEVNTQRKVILLKPVILADFLDQPQIVFNHKPNQLHQAANHLWAQPLDKSIALSVAETINQQSADYRAELLMQQRLDTADYWLQLRVDKFYPTHQKTAVLTGRYWLYEKQGKTLVLSRDFTHEAQLEQSGYEHAIAQMRGLVTEFTLALIKQVP